MKNSFKMNALVAIVGAILLFLVSPYTWAAFFPQNLFSELYNSAIGRIFPFSFGFFIMLFLLRSFSFFVTSILFALLSLFAGRKKYIYFFLVFISIFMIIDFSYIIKNWSYGFRFQGKYYTIMVTIANGIFFFLLYFLAFIFKKTKKIQWIHGANFLFCLMLIFLMFPWLGENL